MDLINGKNSSIDILRETYPEIGEIYNQFGHIKSFEFFINFNLKDNFNSVAKFHSEVNPDDYTPILVIWEKLYNYLSSLIWARQICGQLFP